MFDMMSQARNAIEAYNEALKASSANIANMNVIGYKRVDVSFQTVFERVINQGSAASNEMGGTNPKQLGSSMNVANVSVDFSDGEYASANNIDLAISGNGLFIEPDEPIHLYYKSLALSDLYYDWTMNGNNRWLRLRMNAFETGKKLDATIMAQKYEAIFEKLLQMP